MDEEGQFSIKTKKAKIKRAEEAHEEEEAAFKEEYENIDCPKCSAKKVISWMEQTRASDEPPTRFYKCTKCGHTWREYS
jgi:DNA-directed RNA polymerase subunit M